MPKQDARAAAGRRRPWLLAGAATAALLLASAAPGSGAAAQELGPVERVNGRSPFAGCRADRVGQQAGDVYPNTEIEPWVASNPASPDNLVAVWQQDRWSNGGARGNAGAVSRDGGRSWRTVVPPGVTLCTGGEYDRASDPWVDFSPNGTAYFMHLAFDQDLPNGGFGPNAMLVSRSSDGGASFGRPITLIRDTNPQVLNDKNSLTADPTNPSFAYAVWDRLQDFTIDPETGAAPAAGKTGGGARGARARAKLLRADAARAESSAEAAEPELIFKGPIFLARTTNGGRTWERAREVYDPGDNAQTIGNQVLVAPDGTVIDFFTEITQEFVRVALLRSTDKGRTFERRPRAVGDIVFTETATITPDARAPVRDAQILFDIAVDVATDTLHAVWQDARFRGVEEVVYAASRDGGATWSRPVRINKTPASANRLRQQAFIPSIEVGPGGVLVVTYYDFRNDRGGRAEELTDHWAIFCEIGEDAPDCTTASRWGGELRLTRSSFDMLDAPIAGGHFVGDYVGLERAGDAVLPLYSIATGDDLTDLFARQIALPGRWGVASLGR